MSDTLWKCQCRSRVNKAYVTRFVRKIKFMLIMEDNFRFYILSGNEQIKVYNETMDHVSVCILYIMLSNSFWCWVGKFKYRVPLRKQPEKVWIFTKYSVRHSILVSVRFYYSVHSYNRWLCFALYFCNLEFLYFSSFLVFVCL